MNLQTYELLRDYLAIRIRQHMPEVEVVEEVLRLFVLCPCREDFRFLCHFLEHGKLFRLIKRRRPLTRERIFDSYRFVLSRSSSSSSASSSSDGYIVLARDHVHLEGAEPVLAAVDAVEDLDDVERGGSLAEGLGA